MTNFVSLLCTCMCSLQHYLMQHHLVHQKQDNRVVAWAPWVLRWSCWLWGCSAWYCNDRRIRALVVTRWHHQRHKPCCRKWIPSRSTDDALCRVLFIATGQFDVRVCSGGEGREEVRGESNVLDIVRRDVDAIVTSSIQLLTVPQQCPTSTKRHLDSVLESTDVTHRLIHVMPPGFFSAGQRGELPPEINFSPKILQKEGF